MHGDPVVIVDLELARDTLLLHEDLMAQREQGFALGIVARVADLDQGLTHSTA